MIRIPGSLSFAVISTFFITSLFIAPSAHAYRIGDVDFKITGSASEMYDDNVTYAKDDTKYDLITKLAVGLIAKYEGKMQNFDLSGNIYQDIFTINPKYSNNSQDLIFNYNVELSKHDRISLRNAFSHTYEPRNFEEEFGITPGRYSYFRNRLYADYTRDITKQLSAIVKYNFNVDVPSRDDISDSYFNLGGLELDYAYSTSTIFFATYDFSVRKFSPGSDAYTNAMAGGIRQYITKQVYVDGMGGLDIIRSYDDKDYLKPMVKATITDEINENTRASLGFTKEYYTSAYSQDLFDYWEINGALNSQIMKRLSASGSIFYGQGRYVSAGTTDDLIGANASLTYELTDRIKANLAYRFSMTDSDVRSREYVKNTVSMGIKAEF